MRSRLLPAIALAASVGCGSAPDPAPAPAPSVTVMTWNIQRGQAVAGRLAAADMSPFATLVARNGADVVGLQEVTQDQAQAISRALGWGEPAYVQTKAPCPGFQPPLPGSCVPFGNAILSRYPQSQVEHWLLPPSTLENGREDRVLLRSVVDVDGRPLSVYTTHLAANATDEEREAQVEEALAHIAEDDRPTVLVGDINALPTDDAVTLITGRFVDAWAEVHGGDPGYTSNAVLGLVRRIDYVFAGRGDGLRVERVAVDPEILSDHLAVVATLTVVPG